MKGRELSSRPDKTRLMEFAGFFAGSAGGLLVDLVGFQLLVWLSVAPWLANGVSSLTSITVVYLLVTRYSFGVETRRLTYALFLAWYVLSIVVFSGLIQMATSLSGLDPMIWKLCSVPVSFSFNYLFSRVLFRQGVGRSAGDVSRSEE